MSKEFPVGKIQEYLNEDKIDIFMYERDYSLSPEAVIDLWNHPTVQDRLTTRWEYETSEELWPSRPEARALSETVLHMLAYLRFEVDFYKEGIIAENPFPELDGIQLEETFGDLGVLYKYFSAQMYGKNSSL